MSNNPSAEEVAAAQRLMIWKDFVPQSLRFPLIVLIVMINLFSGGVYMSAASHMSSSLSWNMEDVMMAGYTSMLGLTMAFPMLFRIMFRFQPRRILMFSSLVFILCDYICMVCDFLPLVILVSFIGGFFGIICTFICWSTVQLKITPTRDFSVFFPFIFTFVIGSIQIITIVTCYTIYYFDWQMMHRITIGGFIFVFALVFFCMRRNYRQAPFMPFYGIDFLGCVLWTLLILTIVFIFNYGDHFDWLDGKEIPTAIVFAIVLLFLTLNRANNIRHPYINIQTFKQNNVLLVFLLFTFMMLMSATSGSMLSIFTESILNYSPKHTADITWGALLGVVAGTSFFYFAFTKHKMRLKTMVVFGFLSFFIFQTAFYFLIDPSTERWMIFLAMIFKGAGLGILYSALTYALSVSVHFELFFQSLCIIGFIRTGFGSPLGSAIVTRIFKSAILENTANLSCEIDAMHPLSSSINSILPEFQKQVLMVSLKEVFGYMAIAAILIIIAILLSDYKNTFKNNVKMPRMAQVWKMEKKHQ
ncbi:MAG: MFS transporter [Candidatus Limimorpha sp.]